MRGTLTGEFDGMAPTRKSAEVAGFGILWFEDGWVIEWWWLTTVFDLGRHLDVFPTRPHALLRIAGRQIRWKLGWGRKR